MVAFCLCQCLELISHLNGYTEVLPDAQREKKRTERKIAFQECMLTSDHPVRFKSYMSTSYSSNNDLSGYFISVRTGGIVIPMGSWLIMSSAGI